jgi:hypothetical protein
MDRNKADATWIEKPVKMWLPVTTNRTPAWAYPAKQKKNKRDLEKFLNHMPQFY